MEGLLTRPGVKTSMSPAQGLEPKIGFSDVQVPNLIEDLVKRSKRRSIENVAIIKIERRSGEFQLGDAMLSGRDMKSPWALIASENFGGTVPHQYMRPIAQQLRRKKCVVVIAQSFEAGFNRYLNDCGVQTYLFPTLNDWQQVDSSFDASIFDDKSSAPMLKLRNLAKPNYYRCVGISCF